MFKGKMIIHQIYKKTKHKHSNPSESVKGSQRDFFAFDNKLIVKKEKWLKTHFRAFYRYAKKLDFYGFFLIIRCDKT